MENNVFDGMPSTYRLFLTDKEIAEVLLIFSLFCMF